MPVVPKGPQPGTVQAARAPDVRSNNFVSRETFGGGQSFERVTSAIKNLVDGEIDKANRMAVLEAQNELSDFKNSFLNGDDEVEGALQFRGKRAAEIPDIFDEEYSKKREEIFGRLSGKQQELFSGREAAFKNDMNAVLQRHVNKELFSYENELAESTVFNEQQNLLNEVYNPAKVALSVKRQKEVIGDLARDNGLSDEFIEKKNLELTTATHTNVITSLVDNGNVSVAKQHFKNNSSEIEAGQRKKIKALLDEGQLRGGAQQIAAKIFAKSSNRFESLQAARQIGDLETQALVKDILNKEWSNQNAAIRERENQVYLEASNIVDSNPGVPVREAIPPSQWELLTEPHKKSLREKAAGREIKDDTKAWLQFSLLSPEQLADLNQSELEINYLNKLTPSNRSKATKEYSEALSGGSFKSFTPTSQLSQDLFQTAKENGFLKNKSSANKLEGDDQKFFRSLLRSATEDITQFERENERKASPEERQAIADRALSKVVNIPGLFGSTPAVIRDVPEEDRSEVFVPIKRIPKQAQEIIRNEMRANNVRVTEDLIEKAYAANRLGDRQRFNQIVKGQISPTVEDTSFIGGGQ